jgi:hypothetical protein
VFFLRQDSPPPSTIAAVMLEVLSPGRLPSVPPASLDAIVRALASRSTGTPVNVARPHGDMARQALRMPHTVETDTEMMIAMLDERQRAKFERTIMRPGA